MNDEHDIAEDIAGDIAEEVVERRMDWALGEVVGDERAPDVVMAVMARRAAQLVESQQVRVTGRGGPLLNAAMLVLGLVVVAWVMFASRNVDEAGSPHAQEPEFVVVTTLAQLRALPADTRAVELLDLGDEGFIALAKQCPTLERLRVRGRGPDLRSFEVLGEGGGYAELVEADLTGCVGVQDVFVAKLIQAKTMASIAIGGTAVTAAVVPFLEMTSQVRHVDFGEAPWLTLEMVEQLVMGGKKVRVARPGDAAFERRVAALAELYEHVSGPFIHGPQTLEELRNLPAFGEHVALRGLGDEAIEILAHRRRLRALTIYGTGRGEFGPQSLALIARLRELQQLRLFVPDWTGEGVSELVRLPDLSSLDLSGSAIDDRALQVLARMPSLSSLTVNGWCRIGAAGVKAIARCQGLETLQMVSCAQLEDAAVAELGVLSSLRELDLTGTPVGPRAMVAIGQLRNLEQLKLSSGDGGLSETRDAMDLQPLAHLGKLRRLQLSGRELDPEALSFLPVSLHILLIDGCRGLGSAAGAAIRDRFPELIAVGVSRSQWIDDRVLSAILEAPSLMVLSAMDCANATPAVLPAIVAAESLHHLDASRSTFLDDVAAETLRRERPDLQVVRKVW